MDQLRLVRPALARAAQREAMRARSLAVDAETGYVMRDHGPDPAAFVRTLENEAAGIDLAAGFVPQSTFWLVLDDAIVVGEIKVRHYLTPALEDRGGHIGYIIHPDYRGRGYGTRQLALVLPETRALGLARVLLTCYAHNIASARIIEANGGVLASESVSPVDGKMTRRYWIGL